MKKILLFISIVIISNSLFAQDDKDTTGIELNLTPETKFTFGGALWINYAYQDWKTKNLGRKQGLNFDNLRLSMDGTYGEHLLFSAQYRIYSYTRAIHHGWIGYKFGEGNQVEMGITQVPFGILPFANHSFWFGLGYYIGMEDDYDTGIKWKLDKKSWNLHLAFFFNEEYNDATNLNRYSADLARVEDQQNEEFSQVNLRFAYIFGQGTSASTEFGLSGEYGLIDNLSVDDDGYRWKAAFHYVGWYGDWNPEFQIARYEFNPKNPAGIDDRLVLIGNLTATRLIAAKGNVINANLRRFWDVNWGVFHRFRVYYNYSTILKDESSFKTSEIHDLGCVLQAGPFWIWIDNIFGKNAMYLNDTPDNSGLGAGGTDKWEYRYNMNFEWYF